MSGLEADRAAVACPPLGGVGRLAVLREVALRPALRPVLAGRVDAAGRRRDRGDPRGRPHEFAVHLLRRLVQPRAGVVDHAEGPEEHDRDDGEPDRHGEPAQVLVLDGLERRRDHRSEVLQPDESDERGDPDEHEPAEEAHVPERSEVPPGVVRLVLDDRRGRIVRVLAGGLDARGVRTRRAEGPRLEPPVGVGRVVGRRVATREEEVHVRQRGERRDALEDDRAAEPVLVGVAEGPDQELGDEEEDDRRPEGRLGHLGQRVEPAEDAREHPLHTQHAEHAGPAVVEDGEPRDVVVPAGLGLVCLLLGEARVVDAALQARRHRAAQEDPERLRLDERDRERHPGVAGDHERDAEHDRRERPDVQDLGPALLEGDHPERVGAQDADEDRDAREGREDPAEAEHREGVAVVGAAAPHEGVHLVLAGDALGAETGEVVSLSSVETRLELLFLELLDAGVALVEGLAVELVLIGGGPLHRQGVDPETHVGNEHRPHEVPDPALDVRGRDAREHAHSQGRPPEPVDPARPHDTVVAVAEVEVVTGCVEGHPHAAEATEVGVHPVGGGRESGDRQELGNRLAQDVTAGVLGGRCARRCRSCHQSTSQG